MTAQSVIEPTPRRRWAIRLLWVAVPLLSLGYQIAAKQTAEALSGVPMGLHWLAAALALPWGRALIGFELAAFAAWMVVLSEVKLSEAFPLSAISYVLVIVASWTLFHETGDALQLLAGAAILAGVWLIGRKGDPS